MKIKKEPTKEKISFYIDKNLVKRMKPFVVKVKKTDFINRSIEEKITQLEKEKAKKEILHFLNSIKPVKAKKTASQMLCESRGERFNRIKPSSKKTNNCQPK